MSKISLKEVVRKLGIFLVDANGQDGSCCVCGEPSRSAIMPTRLGYPGIPPRFFWCRGRCLLKILAELRRFFC